MCKKKKIVFIVSLESQETMVGGQLESIAGFYFSKRADLKVLKVFVTSLNRFFKPCVKKVTKKIGIMDELLRNFDEG